MFRSSRLSPDETYRATLTRWFDSSCKAKCCEGGELPAPGFIGWILNNPSTADGFADDPTIRRLWAYTRFWGFNAMHVVNTNPYRCTEPKHALMPPDNVLEVNDKWLAEIHTHSAITMCAWGDKANPALVERAVRILHPLGALFALRVMKNGNPQHPLYLPGTLTPQLWKPEKWIH